MAVLTPADFLTKYNPLFADNWSGDISEGDLRDFMVDCKDSFAFAADIVDVDAAIEAFRTAVKTLTNKRIVKRTLKSVTVPSGSLDIDSDSYDFVVVTALDADITIPNPTGTPEDGQEIRLMIKDDGVVRNFVWGGKIIPLNIGPPASSTSGKWTLVDLLYNKNVDRWYCINRRVEL